MYVLVREFTRARAKLVHGTRRNTQDFRVNRARQGNDGEHKHTTPDRSTCYDTFTTL